MTAAAFIPALTETSFRGSPSLLLSKVGMHAHHIDLHVRPLVLSSCHALPWKVDESTESYGSQNRQVPASPHRSLQLGIDHYPRIELPAAEK